jgi:hypothetical protein
VEHEADVRREQARLRQGEHQQISSPFIATPSAFFVVWQSGLQSAEMYAAFCDSFCRNR